MENYSYLSVLIAAPFFLGVLSVLSPKSLQRSYAILGALALFLVSLFLCSNVLFSTTPGVVIDQKISWFPAMGLTLNLRLDSVSVWFVLLNAVVCLLAFSLSGVWNRKFPRLFSFLGFSMTGFLNGAFLCTDLVVFYIFYEAVFVPMILMIGIWGESTKAAAVFKFFLMSLLGSVLMLVSIFYLMSIYHTATGRYSGDLADLITVASKDPNAQWCFFGFFLAFAIKVPMVPFHAWLKDAYTMAPMPATLWMSAILSKLGVFGLIRFVLPLFGAPLAEVQPLLLGLCAVSILYPAFLAIRARDPKTLLSYSSISHLGFVLFGVFSLSPGGVAAAVLLSVGHTLVSAGLFYILHLVEVRRGGLRLDTYHGLAKEYPLLFLIFFGFILGGVALPGTANFVGEFLVMISAFQSNPVAVVIGGLGVIFGALYLLRFYQRLGFGEVTGESSGRDIELYDVIVLIGVLFFVIILGFQPLWVMKGNGT